MKKRALLLTASTLVLGVLTFSLPSSTASREEVRSFHFLTSSNGHSSLLFDSEKNDFIAMLDHPYRYLYPQEDLRKEGIERRNLLEHLKVGIKQGADVSWLNDWTPEESGYLHDSNIIFSHVKKDDQKIERYFYSPFGLEKNAVVILTKTEKPMNIVTNLGFHLGGHPVSPIFWHSYFGLVKVPGEKVTQAGGSQAWIEQGQTHGRMIYIPLQQATKATCSPDCVADEISLSLESTATSDGWSGVLIAYVEDETQVLAQTQELMTWIRERAPKQILQDSLAEFEAWRKPAPVEFQNESEKRVWRQSEAVLRMGQVREPNLENRFNHGMMLASLSPGHWLTGWVRDGIYATVALSRSGHHEEARQSLDFFLNARPVGLFKEYVENYPYRISVTRYFGNGTEEADYSNQKTPNVETDGWGLVLWGARQYVDNSGDLAWLSTPTYDGTVYEALRDGVAKAIESELEQSPRIMKPDSSIWEVHEENAKHFAYTTLTAARGLCDFASLAKRYGRKDDARKFAQMAEDVRRDFITTFTAPQGHLISSLEKIPHVEVDGAVLEAFGLDVLPDFKSDVARKTYEFYESKLRVTSGGYKRIDGSEPYEFFEWPFIDFRMMNTMYRMNDRQKADALMALIVKRAALNFHVLPEMFISQESDGVLGAYALTGSNPMVGYGAGAYIMTMMERDGLFENRSCE